MNWLRPLTLLLTRPRRTPQPHIQSNREAWQHEELVLLNHGKHVVLTYNDHFVIHSHFRLPVAIKQDSIPLLNLWAHTLSVGESTPLTDRQDTSLLRKSLRCLRQENPTGSRRFCSDSLHDQIIAQWLDSHLALLSVTESPCHPIGVAANKSQILARGWHSYK
jgi:hypothetical protein